MALLLTEGITMTQVAVAAVKRGFVWSGVCRVMVWGV